MPRPQNKNDLLTEAEATYKLLTETVAGMDSDTVNSEFGSGTLNRNVRDVLMHLHHWHLMLLEWYETGMSGKKPEMPAKGYTWKTTPELNLWINRFYCNVIIEDALHLLDESHRKVMALIEGHTDPELFEKRKYQWTGSTSLGAYLVSATSSHYAWALKLIKKSVKT